MGSLFSAERLEDKYEFVKKLGEGGFGVVWKVKCRKSGEEYAAKVLKQARVDQVAAVKKEIEILKNVGAHVNIVQLQDVLVFDMIYILMEFCDLGDLDGYMKTNYTSIQFEPLMSDMINGLRFLHRKALAHRDLKPANILLSTFLQSRPICKIAGIGLSKFVNPPPEQSNISSGAPGSYLSTHCGTPYYMAPEIEKGEYKKECDVFSLGAIFFVLCSKQMKGSGDGAFLAPTIEGKMLRHVTASQMKSAVASLIVEPEGFRELIIMMLKQDYKERARIDTVYQMYRHFKGGLDDVNT